MIYSDLIIKPGETILDLLTERKISKKKLASKMNITMNELEQIINGDIKITDDVAEKLDNVFHLSKRFWLNLERRYREELDIVRNNMEKNNED